MTYPQGQQEVAFVEAQLGKPYVWGATGPNSYDCSGLVYAALKAAGVPVSRVTAATFGTMGVAESLANAEPGDVVYFDEPGATDHVGILVDTANGGHMIDAPTAGKPVEVDPIKGYTSIRRIVGGTVTNAPTQTAAGAAVSDAASAVTDAIGSLFSGWQTDLLGVGVKLAAAGIAGTLVIVGAWAAMRDRGSA